MKPHSRLQGNLNIEIPILFFSALLLLTLASGALAAPSQGIVVIPGARLPALSGVRISALAAFALPRDGAGGLRPIPFQVDERDPSGRYVVDRRVAGEPSDLPRDDGRFDANDEAVFEIADAGGRVSPKAWSSQGSAMEIEIEDPFTGQRRYVYLLTVAHAPEPPRRDVHYDPTGSGRVDAKHYTLGFGARSIFVKSLALKTLAGGNGKNLVKGTRYKAYSRLSPFLLSLRINRDNEDLVTTVLGYREGPVRLVRLVKRHTKLVLGLATPERVRTEFYSASQAEWREEVGYSLDMKRLIARSVVEYRMKLTREAAGSTFLCEGGERKVIDGKDGGGDLPLASARWWGVTGPAGSFYVRYALGGEGEQELLFDDGEEGMGGWRVDVMSMGGRIQPLTTRFVFPRAEVAADPARVPWIGAPEPKLRARTAAEINGRTPLYLGPSGPAQAKGIHRRYDVVTLTGYALRPQLGVPVANLRLYAAREGRLVPVPFQVDERDGEGRFVLPSGKARGEDVDGGRLDDNDEIVTMADRLGDRVDRSAWPPGVRRGSEIEVRDPLDGESGWLYLFAFDEPPPLATERLVHRKGFDKVLSEVFTVGFPEEKAYFDHFTMKTAARKEFSDNLVDRLKIRFRLTFRFLYIPLPYRAGEDDFGRQTIAYREGPIRVIFRQDLLVKLTFGVTFHMEPSDWIFYENQAVSEVIVKNPYLYGKGALKRVTNAHFLQTVDLDHSASGLRFLNSENTQSVLIDGEMSKAEKDLDKRKDRWAIITGEQAHTVVRIRFLDGMDPERSLVYVDDKNKKDWHDRDYGQWGNTGYDVDLKAEGSIMLLTSPSYTIILYFYLPPDFDPEKREEILNILDHPIEVRASEEGAA
jgi:hypothetical protein